MLSYTFKNYTSIRFFAFWVALVVASASQAQFQDTCRIPNAVADANYIYEVQDSQEKDKVLHAEPLFIDLIRDLGARKGESEWNIGAGINDRLVDDNYTYLVEYEFAPIDRVGMEIELPLTVYGNRPDGSIKQSTRLNSIKVAGQYSFFVSEKLKTSMAFGYIHEFTLVPFRDMRSSPLIDGNVFNPFFIAAKRWGRNFHTLYYGGPYIHTFLNAQPNEISFQNNFNVHFMIPGTRNFIGVEFNHSQLGAVSELIIRPQMRISIADNIMIGVVTGLPLQKGNERLSSFFRLIYEPSHKHK